MKYSILFILAGLSALGASTGMAATNGTVQTASAASGAAGDLDGDGGVNLDDLVLFASNWLKQNFLLKNYVFPKDETGYDLWLRYPAVENEALLNHYKQSVREIVCQGENETLLIARNELSRGLDSMLEQETAVSSGLTQSGSVVIGTPETSSIIAGLGWTAELNQCGAEGYIVRSAVIEGKNAIVVASAGKMGVVYGSFHLLRLVQMHSRLEALNIVERPRIQRRILNHWDGLKGTSKAIYSGPPIWKWDELPGKISPRYADYGRANASIGINGTVVNSLGADPVILTAAYISKTAAIASALRPYGIKVYLSANFAAPMSLGKLPTADPLDPAVRQWWAGKADEIWAAIPDFGGFLVKADSEGMPGPWQYGRTHADGANMLAQAVAPHGGIVMWRAFVYGSALEEPDRIKQAYAQFKPLDGQFADNVFLQVKNGPLDFQPREPVMPLYGAMPNTSLMMEFEVRQEYLGASIHLVYLAPMWEEVLKFDTRCGGPGMTVGKIVDGSAEGHTMSGIAGVANIGSDIDWCGHHFLQADWYCFGRQAWDHTLTSQQIAEEWAGMTFGTDPQVKDTVVSMMMGSHEACVNYMTPLGLHVLCGSDHYNPAPQNRMSYHMANAAGLGYDRTTSGSNGVGQYCEPYRSEWNNLGQIPEKYLCWFHHVPWDRTMSSGRTFWNELCYRYQSGAAYVKQMRADWLTLEGKVDAVRWADVLENLDAQVAHSELWRDTCLLYFQLYSGRPIPAE